MRVAIIGSRRFKNADAVVAFVKTLEPGTIVVSGGCKGPDSWAEDTAKSLGYKVEIFLPDLPTKNSPRHEYTKAYYARNEMIVKNSDVIHAFVSADRTGGTEHTIRYAKKSNVPVVIH